MTKNEETLEYYKTLDLGILKHLYKVESALRADKKGRYELLQDTQSFEDYIDQYELTTNLFAIIHKKEAEILRQQLAEMEASEDE